MRKVILKNFLLSLIFATLITCVICVILGKNPNIWIALFCIAFATLEMFICSQTTNMYKEDALESVNTDDVIHSQYASCWNSINDFKGFLIITKYKLVFYHFYSRRNTEILIKDIINIKPYNILGIFSSGLKIITKNKTYKFEVLKRTKLVEILKMLIFKQN